MEEQAAHELYTEFAAVDAGARFKQGIGFAGRGARAELQGWADKDDDDVIARNRRLFGGDRGRQDERRSPEYDSDTAEAVQRRLRALKKEQRAQQAEGPAPLPERLYDERREQRQARQPNKAEERQARVSQPDRAEERRHDEGRHSHSEGGHRHSQRRRSRSRQRRRSRSREARRSRSRSCERQRRHQSNSWHHRRRSRSRSREREQGRHHRPHARSRSRSPRSWGELHVQQRGRHTGRASGGGGNSSGAAAAGGAGAGGGLQKLDFEALIPGYSAMTAPQKLKAKTQYLLERNEARDRKQQERGRQEEGGEQQHWTRFKFSDAAELEEHRLQPAAVYGEGNEEADDVAAAGLGGLSAVTFKQSNAAAVQQERDDWHAAAIFGGGGGSGAGAGAGARGSAAATGAAWPRHAAAAAAGRHRQQDAAGGPQTAAEGPQSWLGRGAAGAAGSEEDLLALAEAEGAVIVPAAEVAAVLHQPQQAAAVGGGSGGSGALSWRERALAAKRAKQQQ